MNYAQINIGGRLTRDPETKQVGDNEVTSFPVAVNIHGSDEPDYYECSAWGKRGLVIAQHFKKGKPIAVWGQLRIDRWQGNDGQPRQTLRLTVDGFSFAGDTRDDAGTNNAAGKPRSARSSQPDPDYGEPVSSEEIPF